MNGFGHTDGEFICEECGLREELSQITTFARWRGAGLRDDTSRDVAFFPLCLFLLVLSLILEVDNFLVKTEGCFQETLCIYVRSGHSDTP